MRLQLIDFFTARRFKTSDEKNTEYSIFGKKYGSKNVYLQ